MKVLIQYTQSGKYRDQAWEGYVIREKGEFQTVTPSYAAQLIEQNKARLITTGDGKVVISHF